MHKLLQRNAKAISGFFLLIQKKMKHQEKFNRAIKSVLLVTTLLLSSCLFESTKDLAKDPDVNHENNLGNPQANAGLDTAIAFGDTLVLHGTSRAGSSRIVKWEWIFLGLPELTERAISSSTMQ